MRLSICLTAHICQLGVMLSIAAAALAAGPGEPIRIADVVGGHIHPAVCVTRTGEILVVYNKQGGGGKELLLCRSTDGGKHWSEPQAVPGISDCSIYPGSLTTLADGRIVLMWSCYRNDDRAWRQPQYCISDNGGRTWSDVVTIQLDDYTNYSCLRHPISELSPRAWVLPLYDRTVILDPASGQIRPFGDGRNHGMVPIVRTSRGTLLSGAPQEQAPVPVGKPGSTTGGLRSTDGGKSWQPLFALGYFGVAGYDLTVLDDDRIVFTRINYGVGRDVEWSYDLLLSRDDGRTFDQRSAVEIYSPGREIKGRGWPRTVQLDDDTLGTVFFDLSIPQPAGPGVFFVRTPIAALETGRPAGDAPK